MYFGSAKRNVCQRQCNSLQLCVFERECQPGKCMQHPARHPITAGTFYYRFSRVVFFYWKTWFMEFSERKFHYCHKNIHPPLGKANEVFCFHLDFLSLWVLEPNHVLGPIDMLSVSTLTARVSYGSCSFLVLHVGEHQTSSSLSQP